VCVCGCVLRVCVGVPTWVQRGLPSPRPRASPQYGVAASEGGLLWAWSAPWVMAGPGAHASWAHSQGRSMLCTLQLRTHMHAQAHTQAHTHTLTLMHTHAHAHTRTHARTRTHTHTGAHTHARTHTHIHTHARPHSHAGLFRGWAHPGQGLHRPCAPHEQQRWWEGRGRPLLVALRWGPFLLCQ